MPTSASAVVSIDSIMPRRNVCGPVSPGMRHSGVWAASRSASRRANAGRFRVAGRQAFEAALDADEFGAVVLPGFLEEVGVNEARQVLVRPGSDRGAQEFVVGRHSTTSSPYRSCTLAHVRPLWSLPS